jgi:hypothetical protein
VRKFSGIGCTRKDGLDRTLRDGSLEVALSRHFVPGYDRVVPPGQLDSNMSTHHLIDRCQFVSIHEAAVAPAG